MQWSRGANYTPMVIDTHLVVYGSVTNSPMAVVCAQLFAMMATSVSPHLHLQSAVQGDGLQSVAHVNPGVSTLLVHLSTPYLSPHCHP
jgi:hypothetical protein